MRTYFKKNKQEEFINTVLAKITVVEAARLCNLSTRTIRDWRREKFLADYDAVKILSHRTGIKIPSDIKLIPVHWRVILGARRGMMTALKRYGSVGGDPEYRKQRRREWWEKKGKYRSDSIIKAPLPFKKPRFSLELAEFVGILLGDGGITKQQITISLNGKDEKEYSEFVLSLAKRLFGVYVGVYNRKSMSVIIVRICRSGIVRYCVEKLGLKIGNKIKQQVDIPDWIRQNKKFSIACVRGLIDTDGCAFTHYYKVNGKLYDYKKLAFSSLSEPLRLSVFQILKSLGIKSRLCKRKDIWLDSEESIKQYFSIIGTHNRKLLNKYLDKV